MTAVNQKRRISILWLALLCVVALLGIAPLEESFDASLFRGLRPRHPAPIVWEALEEGFDRTVLKFEGEALSDDPRPKLIPRRIEIVVFRIDPLRYPVRVITAERLFGQKKASLAEVHRRVGAVITVNGGFFTREGDPKGLVISDSKLRNAWAEDGGSGAVAVYNGGIIRIGWAVNVAMAVPRPDQALQNGPLIVEPEHVFGIVHIREKFFSRTIAALDDQGRLLIGVTRKLYDDKNVYSGLNLYETAKIFYHAEGVGGLNARAAINLDGGTSTGMEFSLGPYSDRVKVGITLPNFVCIMPAK